MFSAPHSSSNPQARQFAGAYHQVGVQTMVSGASAHGLVALIVKIQTTFVAFYDPNHAGRRLGDTDW